MFKKTVDSVTASFNKIIADLEAVKNAHIVKNAWHRLQLDVHTAEANFHAAEVARATRIGDKVTELLS